MPPSDIKLGIILGGKGLKGKIVVKWFTEEPNGLQSYGKVNLKDGRSFELTVEKLSGDKAICSFPDIENRAQADALKGECIYISKSELPELKNEEYYYADLISMQVEDQQGEVLGAIHAVHDFGAGHILEVSGKISSMIPFNKNYVLSVDLKQSKIKLSDSYLDFT